MTDIRYWIWLQNVIGYGEKTSAILREAGSPEIIYGTDISLLRSSGLFKKLQLERMMSTPLSFADDIIKTCIENDISIITPDSSFYPELLKETADFPLVLYVKGDKSVLRGGIHIGVIGTRKPSQYGIDVAYTMTRVLSENGAVVISGGALGIDSVAHSAAMECGAKTILIMGCGHGCEYLMENEDLRERVTQNGALITEFPPFTPPTKTSFIQRNRITAGICRGVLVIEAGEKSGTLSTARKSFSYGRDVFVVTGDAKGTSFLGAHELVKSGAKVIFSAQDILSLYSYEIKNKDSFYFGSMGKAVFEGINEFPVGIKPEEKNKAKKVKKTEENKTESYFTDEIKEPERQPDLSLLGDCEIKVYNAIKDGTGSLDDISRTLGIQIRDVLIALTNLEMEGLIECGAGNEYTLV